MVRREALEFLGRLRLKRSEALIDTNLLAEDIDHLSFCERSSPPQNELLAAIWKRFFDHDVLPELARARPVNTGKSLSRRVRIRHLKTMDQIVVDQTESLPTRR